MLTNTEDMHGKKVPPHMFEYALKNTADMFRYKTAFEKVKNRDNPIASTFTNNWIYQTKFNLPGMLKWSEVVKQPPMQEVSPIVTTVDMMQRKNWEYEMMALRLAEDKDSMQISTNELEQSLFGVILPQVGGGTPKIEEAFLTAEYEKANPDHKGLIKQLKDEIKKQIHILDLLLPFFEYRVKGDIGKEPVLNAFKEHHKINKKKIKDTYGENDDDTLKVRFLEEQI